MEIEYVINKVGSRSLSHAHIKPMELERGEYRVYFGGDLEEQDRIIKERPDTLRDKRIVKYPSIGLFLEEFCEHLVTHEFLHLIVYELTQSTNAVYDYDNIDDKDQICAPDFWGSPF